MTAITQMNNDFKHIYSFRELVHRCSADPKTWRRLLILLATELAALLVWSAAIIYILCII
jgi:hypothetical protein